MDGASRSNGRAHVTSQGWRGEGAMIAVSLSTRTYIILAALTGLAILVAFAVQVMGAR
jgi:hypothetical protein